MNVRKQRICCLIAFENGVTSKAELNRCLAELDRLDPSSDTEFILLRKQLVTQEQYQSILSSLPDATDAGGGAERVADALSQASTKLTRHPRATSLPRFSGSIVGRYRILGKLGHGGMGAIYKAHDEELDCVVALKMLLAGELATDREVERFRREARSIARLQHPGIVRVRDIGEFEGRWFFTMDYVDGKALNELLKTQEISVPQTLKVATEIAEALEHAHSQGVIHRDVKPANIIIGRDGRAYLTDFGLAKRLDVDEQLTAPGMVLGTFAYMPPEQAKPDAGEPDARSDVYALGATVYEMLTGRRVFTGSALEIRMSIISELPEPPRSVNPSISEALQRIVLKALAKDPAERWESAAAFLAVLQQELQKLTPAAPVWSGEPLRARRRSRLPLLLGVAAAAVVAAAAALLVWHFFTLSRFREAERLAASRSPDDRVAGLEILKRLGGSSAQRLAYLHIFPGAAPKEADAESPEEARVRWKALEVYLSTAGPGGQEERAALLTGVLADPSPLLRRAVADHVKAGAFAVVPAKQRVVGLLGGLSGQPAEVREEISGIVTDTLLKEKVPVELSPQGETFQECWEARIWLIDFLFRHRGEEAIGVLRGMALGDPDEDVRKHAVEALAAVGGASQLDALAKVARNDVAVAVRLAAVDALRDLRIPQAHDELLALVKDPSGSVRAAVVRALGNYETEEATGTVLAMLDDTFVLARREAIVVAGQLRIKKAVPRLGQLLAPQGDQMMVRQAAAEALGQIAGEEAAGLLRAALEGGESTGLVLKVIINAIGELKDAEAVPQLIRVVHSDRLGSGAVAATALARIGLNPDEVIEAVAAGLRRGGLAKYTYSAVLNELIKPTQFSILVNMLSQEDRILQDCIYEILMRESRPDGLDALINCGLASEEAEVRAGSFDLLLRKTAKSFGYDPAAPQDQRDLAVERWRQWRQAEHPQEASPTDQ